MTIPSDGRAVWAPVDAVETKATAKLVAAPKLVDRVYQVVALNTPTAYPLLEGRIRSYRSGSFVGESQLRYRGVGEPFEVSLGIDDELKVERKVLGELNRQSGFLSSTARIEQAYRTVLANRARGAETVELRESIPVSKVEDVKVDLDRKRTTPGFNLDAGRGFLTWQVRLDPAQEKSVDIAYVIRLPDDWVAPR